MPTFSIIVPIHSGEPHLLKDCIRSIVHQDVDDYECLLVCDDESLNGVDVPAKFHVFRVEPSSIGFKRNYACKQSQGDYILFVDADDLIASNCLSVASDVIKKVHPDLICFNYTSDLEKFQNQKPIFFQPTLLSPDEIRKNIFEACFYSERPAWKDGCFIGAVWGKVFKRDIIFKNSLLVPDFDYSFEDKIFDTDFAYHCSNSCAVLEDFVGYYWRPNLKSVSHSVKPLANYAAFYDACISMAQKNGFTVERTRFLQQILGNRYIDYSVPYSLGMFSRKCSLLEIRNAFAQASKTKFFKFAHSLPGEAKGDKVKNSLIRLHCFFLASMFAHWYWYSRNKVLKK